MRDWNNTLWTEAPYVVLDTETTGVRKADTICEVSLQVVEDGRVVDTYHTLINPRQPIPEMVTAIHGITDADVVDAPVIEDVADDILAFLAMGVPLVAHGLAFDVRMFLRCEQIAAAWPRDIPTLCTMDFAKHRNPPTKDLPSHKLTDLVTMFGIYREHKSMHRAVADTTALVDLVPKLMRGRTVAATMTKLSHAWIKV